MVDVLGSMLVLGANIAKNFQRLQIHTIELLARQADLVIRHLPVNRKVVGSNLTIDYPVQICSQSGYTFEYGI